MEYSVLYQAVSLKANSRQRRVSNMCRCNTTNNDLFCSNCYVPNYYAYAGVERIKEILTKHIKKTSLRKTAKYFNVAPSTVHRILKGMNYSDSVYFKIINKESE
jgi:hypothetical protein